MSDDAFQRESPPLHGFDEESDEAEAEEDFEGHLDLVEAVRDGELLKEAEQRKVVQHGEGNQAQLGEQGVSQVAFGPQVLLKNVKANFNKSMSP